MTVDATDTARDDAADAGLAADTLLSGGTLVTMDGRRRIIRDGALAFRGDRLVFVGKRIEAERRVDARETIDASRFVITPGLIDAHIHITGDPLTRGYVPDEIEAGFGEKLTRWVIPRFEAHTAGDERLSAQFAALQMLKSGTTCFLEAGTIRHLDAVVEALEDLGIRGRVGAWVEGRSNDPASASAAIDTAIRLLEDEVARYPADRGARIAAWPILIGHTTNPDEVWLAAKSLADANAIGVSAHMSPHASDAEWFLEHTGRRPISHLAGMGALGSNVSLTHAVHIDKEELRCLADTETNVIHCSLAALRNASGVTSAGLFPEMAKAGINLCLGTDGDMSDLTHTMKTAAAIFKDARRDASVFSAYDTLTMATLNAARALRLEHEIGSLEAGRKADFVLHDTDRPEWRPVLSVVNQLVNCADGRGVHSVWVDGVRLVDNYRATMLDEAALYARAQSAGEAIAARSGVPMICPWPVE